MNPAGQLEGWLADLLRYGSWLALAAIGVGFALALIGSQSSMGLASTLGIARAGIGLLILLPVLRVLLMLLVFILERDFRFASVAGLVLAIILLATLSGISCDARHTRNGRIAKGSATSQAWMLKE